MQRDSYFQLQRRGGEERKTEEQPAEFRFTYQATDTLEVPLTFHGVSELTWESTHQRPNYFDRHHIGVVL